MKTVQTSSTSSIGREFFNGQLAEPAQPNEINVATLRAWRKEKPE